MTVAAIRPNSDNLNNWFSPADPATHYDVVDDAVSYPNNAGTSDFIVNDGFVGTDNMVDDFNFGNLSDVDEVTQIKIYSLGGIFKQGTTAYYPELQYSIDGGSNWYPATPHDCTGHYISTSPTQQYAWDVLTVSSLSWTQTQINNIRIKFIADTPNGDKNSADANFIAVIYIEVTYTSTSTGYDHKVLGVASASIGKVLGVATASIGKVSGV